MHYVEKSLAVCLWSLLPRTRRRIRILAQQFGISIWRLEL